MMLGAGTFSYFDDTEVSTGNTFTAGTIDISLDPTDGQQVETVDGHLDLKPCQTGYITITVYNDGQNPCDVWKRIINVENLENGVVEPEQEYYDSHPNAAGKKISNHIHFDLSVNDCPLIVEEDGYYLTGANGVKGYWMYLGEIQPGCSIEVTQSFHLDKDVGNWGQSDKVTFDEEFFAQQTVGDPLPDPPAPLLDD